MLKSLELETLGLSEKKNPDMIMMMSVGTARTISMQELTLTAITDTEKCTLM